MFTFKGRLCGYLCGECREDLSAVTVRLYRAEGADVAQRVEASPKETFHFLTDRDVEGKSRRLLGEAVTDAEGNFSVDLQKYDGAAVEIDVRCGNVPRRKPRRRGDEPKPLQFSITTLQPQWQGERDRIAIFEYCIPYRYWCLVREKFGAWVICGKVTVCNSDAPAPHVNVKAFDVDWLQDDPLGEDTTDANGHFRIDYNAAEFRKTIFPGIPLEWFGGPDIYFEIRTPGGGDLLIEPPSRGRKPDRENRGPCFCTTVCIPVDIGQPGTEPPPVFSEIGGYNFTTQIDSTPAGDGLTNAGNMAFYNGMRLRGSLPKTLDGAPLEYAFFWQEVAPGASPDATLWQQVLPANQYALRIGRLETLKNPPDSVNPYDVKYYVVGGAPGPNEIAADLTPDNWIKVPQQSDPTGPGGFFYPNEGNLIGFNSGSLGGWDSIDLTGLKAGDDVTSTGHPLARKRWFALQMRARKAGDAGSAIVAGTCRRVAIDNTEYRNIDHHPKWNHFTEGSNRGVCSLDVQELQSEGCARITNNLTVRFTAAQPYYGGVRLALTGPGSYPDFIPVSAPVAGQQFGSAFLPPGTLATMPKCAYIVDMWVTLLLTTGDQQHPGLHDIVAFCKE